MKLIAGVDEVGRGCLAGPVMAAAVILPDDLPDIVLNDSKKMTAKAREKSYFELIRIAKIGVGVVSVYEIDDIGIGAASLLAMQRAVARLETTPDEVWVDGNACPEMQLPTKAFVGGDAKYPCISAASIVAKVLRDQWMTTMDPHFPEFGFAKHKGYGTKQHMQALVDHGACRLHRRSFAPVKQALKL